MLGVCENSLGDFALVPLEKVLGAARTLASQHSKEVAPRKRKGPVRGSADAVGSAVTEDIIIALSQVSSLFVIARNPTFVYKGKPVKVQRVDDDKIGRMGFRTPPTDENRAVRKAEAENLSNDDAIR